MIFYFLAKGTRNIISLRSIAFDPTQNAQSKVDKAITASSSSCFASKFIDRYIEATCACAVKSRAADDSILVHIRKQRVADVARAKAMESIGSLKSRLDNAPALTDWVQRMQSAFPTAVLAEMKRASPSKGDISLDANASEVMNWHCFFEIIIFTLVQLGWTFNPTLHLQVTLQLKYSKFENSSILLSRLRDAMLGLVQLLFQH
jgi:hypothetical protein